VRAGRRTTASIPRKVESRHHLSTYSLERRYKFTWVVLAARLTHFQLHVAASMVAGQARVVHQEVEAVTCELVPRPASTRGLWLPVVVRVALSAEVSGAQEAAPVEKLVRLVGTARKVVALGRERVAAPAETRVESTAPVPGRLARAETALRAVCACPSSADTHSESTLLT